MMEVAEAFTVNAVSRVGENRAAVPSFVDGPAAAAFGEIIFIREFEVLARQAEFAANEAREAAKNTAAGLRRGLYGRGCAVFHD